MNNDFNKNNIIKFLSSKDVQWGRAKKICPKCKDVYLMSLHSHIMINKVATQYNPDLKYCVKCDSIYKIMYVKVEKEVIYENESE